MNEKVDKKKMNKKKNFKVKKMKKESIYRHTLFLIGVGIAFFSCFFYGYILGFQHKHSSLISTILPDFITTINGDVEILSKSFLIKSNFNNEKISINNTISFPYNWYFDQIKIDNNNKDILNPKKYVISSPNGKIKLIIIPKGVNKLRSVMSSTIETTITVTSELEIEKICLGSYDILESDEPEMISLFRENIGENDIRYVQIVDSVANPSEKDFVLDEFLIFKRDGGFIEGDELVWTADIVLEFDEAISYEEREAYLKIVDEIVSSLKIK